MVLAIDVLSAKNFIFFTSFMLLDNHTNEVTPFYSWETGSETLSTFPKVTQLISIGKKEITPGLSDLKVLKAGWLFS